MPPYASIPISADDQILINIPGSTTTTLHEETLTPQSVVNIELQRVVQINNIADIVKKRNLRELNDFGGVRGVAEALSTDLDKGIIISNPKKTCTQFNPNTQLLLTFFHSFLEAWNNYTIFLLSFTAILSLGFGIKEEGSCIGWLNGALIILTILFLVTCTAVHKCWEERSRKKLENNFLREICNKVQVLRGGEVESIKETDLEVGDIAVLRKGDRVLADGIFVDSRVSLELDKNGFIIDEENPFLFYGSRVINGDARMLVTSTGMDTLWGETMKNQLLGLDDKRCKFESYIHTLNTCIHFVALGITILFIIVLFLRYKFGKLDDERRYRPESKGEPVSVKTIVEAMKGIVTGSKPTTRVLTTLLSVSLLGVMEGMPLVISIATIIWSRKTLACKATERDYLACIRMASVTTVICADKFGGLTEHDCKEVEIDKFYVGEGFVCESSVVASNVLDGLCDGIGTVFLTHGDDYCGSELGEMVSWAEAKLGMKRESVIEQCKLISYCSVNIDPLQQLCQVVIMEKISNGRYLHCKGPPGYILSLCSHQYDADGRVQEIDEPKRRTLEQAIQHMQSDDQVNIAFACKRVTTDFNHESSAPVESKDLIFLAMIRQRETRTDDTKRAITCLKEHGIKTVLATGDHVDVLVTIARNCGLLTTDSDEDLSISITAEEFRAWSDEQKMEQADKICVMGNCLPSDKILLIDFLQKKRHAVALLAQRTTDAPALRKADVGITFGSWSSELARGCSDITIWDGNNLFTFLLNVVVGGVHFQENIRKSIQLQLIVTISSTLINFTAVVILGDSAVTTVQLLWLNLVVALAGLALMLTGPPEVTSSSGKLMTKAMWRNIGVQAAYQTIVFVGIQHRGQDMLGTSGGRVKSVIYNGLYLCQMFNKFVAREIERKNFLSGLFEKKNVWFWVGLVGFLLSQVVFAAAEQVIGGTPGLSFQLWGFCFLIGVVSWVLDWIGKTVSNLVAGLFWEI
ncbi:PREDICTED: calcium-transporting ATPase 12, plasma membrane-type-like [Erythranthe guttata]|nr:PREDICTED: calcium-transporting ATPase 12, plasma membrane-type-like [Erythranthe guttata]|eukprot:XP_012848400.1 PREDICTED: calcium-transporting ATPase 12, plasma membrane-type-like [Erythranthe guttata]